MCVSLEPRAQEKKSVQLEKVFEELIAESVPRLVSDINLQIQESEQTPNRISLKKTSPRNIIKYLKVKDMENKS